MKTWIGIFGLSLLVAGCHHEVTLTDKEGNKIAVDPMSPNKMSVTDEKGKTTTAEVGGGGKDMTIKDSEGNSLNISANAVTEADLGVPFYPGSAESEGSVKSGSAKESFVMGHRTTADDPAKVVAFYKSKVKDGKDSSMTIDGTSQATLVGKRADGAEVSILATRPKGETKTTIMITVGTKK